MGGSKSLRFRRETEKYRQGIMSALHKVLFDAIIKKLNGEKSGVFVIQEFVPSVEISRSGAH